MNNLTQTQQQTLDNMAAAGVEIYYLDYDPTVEAAPSVDPKFVEFYRETSTHLVEVIYTDTVPQAPEYPNDTP